MTTDPPDLPDSAAAAEVDVERLLKRFGLSDKEVDTYLTLLDHGEAKASTVAEAAGVSKRYVYSASEELEARGFVTVNDHVTPTTIRANPPEEVIERLANDARSMRPALEARFSRAEATEEPFEVVKSRVTVVKRIRRAVSEATEEVALSFPLGRLDEVADDLREAVDRGVLVLLIVTGVDEGTLDGDATSRASPAPRERGASRCRRCSPSTAGRASSLPRRWSPAPTPGSRRSCSANNSSAR